MNIEKELYLHTDSRTAEVYKCVHEIDVGGIVVMEVFEYDLQKTRATLRVLGEKIGMKFKTKCNKKGNTCELVILRVK